MSPLTMDCEIELPVSFKNSKPFEDRLAESKKIREKYPERIYKMMNKN